MPAATRRLKMHGRRRWLLVLAVLAGVRLAIPLVTLAFSGHALPGLPAYRYHPLNGDSFGFYAATREFISSLGRVNKPLLLLAVRARRRRNGCRNSPLAAIARPPVDRGLVAGRRVSLAVTLPIHQMHPPGAAVFGWPLIWALPLIPIRAVGLGPTPNVAFVVGLVLTLAALAVTVIATAYVGLYATGRRSVGLSRQASSPSGRS